MENLVIIPARGSSVGLPRKNIRKLENRPLISYTINAAKKSKLVNRIIVSTDDAEIAKISLKLGAEVPFLRPKKFARNITTNLEVIKHALKTLNDNESYKPDVVIVLQPTSPFRTFEMIDDSIRLLKKSKASCVLSVTEVKEHPNIIFKHQKKFLKPYKSNFEKNSIRQKRESVYVPTGGIYTFKFENIKKYNSIYGKKICPMFIKDKIINIDIDDLFDFFISEMTRKYWKNYK